MIVSQYSVTRHFGGPEEGGWYYDVRRYERTLRSYPFASEAHREARRLNAEQRHAHGGQGRYSVLGGADAVFYAESTAGEHDNSREPRPRYE